MAEVIYTIVGRPQGGGGDTDMAEVQGGYSSLSPITRSSLNLLIY